MATYTVVVYESARGGYCREGPAFVTGAEVDTIAEMIERGEVIPPPDKEIIAVAQIEAAITMADAG